jgi:hypothetical protein
MKFATVQNLPTAANLGAMFARAGNTYNPYRKETPQHQQFRNGYNAYLARTQYHAEADRTTREQRG